MIPAVTFKAGKKTHKLRLTTGALMRFEEDNEGKPFDVLLDTVIEGKNGIRPIVSVVAAALDDGSGVTKEEAMVVIDEVGGPRSMMHFVGRAIAKAFPAPKAAQDKDADTGKDSPPAGE